MMNSSHNNLKYINNRRKDSCILKYVTIFSFSRILNFIILILLINAIFVLELVFYNFLTYFYLSFFINDFGIVGWCITPSAKHAVLVDFAYFSANFFNSFNIKPPPL